jgi:hypothetical protein
MIFIRDSVTYIITPEAVLMFNLIVLPIAFVIYRLLLRWAR